MAQTTVQARSWLPVDRFAMWTGVCILQKVESGGRMTGDVHSIALLAVAFCVLAFVYASVGFGGGSSYTAMLALSGFAASAVPVLSLGCNLIVAGGGSAVFAWKRLVPFALLARFLLPAVPAAYVGGRMSIAADLYFDLLALSLIATAIFLFLRPAAADVEVRRCPSAVAAVIGSLLGLLSGIVGIGGGIFLSPILMLNRWATPRESAACASVFITINSLAGLAGQLTKPGAVEALAWLPSLALAVLVGGQVGSRFGAGVLRPSLIRRGTACLVMLVGTSLLVNAQ